MKETPQSENIGLSSEIYGQDHSDDSVVIQRDARKKEWQFACQFYIRDPSRKIKQLGISFLACSFLSAPVAVAALHWRFVISGAGAIGGSTALLPLKTIEGIDKWYWISAYIVWGLSFFAAVVLELMKHQPALRKKLFACLAFLLALQMYGCLSQNLTPLDGLTIWGPLLATISLYFTSLLLQAKVDMVPLLG